MSTIVAQARLTDRCRLSILQGDITLEVADAIVNAANPQLAHGGGVAGAIARRAGAEIQQQSAAWVREHGPVGHDRPAVTGAGRLSCRYVLHVVGPVWGEGDEDQKLGLAVRGALRTAEELSLTSLAMPAISTGIYAFPMQRAAGVTLRSIDDYIADHPGGGLADIRVVLWDDAAADAFRVEWERRWPAPGRPLSA